MAARYGVECGGAFPFPWGCGRGRGNRQSVSKLSPPSIPIYTPRHHALRKQIGTRTGINRTASRAQLARPPCVQIPHATRVRRTFAGRFAICPRKRNGRPSPQRR
eukprot:scaffold19969_cov19-Tisochrysis_lutea.AAC.1